MKRLLTAMVSTGLLVSASAVNAESYTRLSYDDVYKTPYHSGVNDYIKLSMGAYGTDLDKKAATLGFGWQRNLPSGFGFGVNINHSLSSSLTEVTSSSNLDMRYVSLAPYLNGEITLLRLDSATALKGYARLGASVVKSEGAYPEAVFEELEYGAYYGAGVVIPFSKYGNFEFGMSAHDAVSITEIQGTVQFLF